MSESSSYLPKKPFTSSEIINKLREYAGLDADPKEGRLFAYVYETGLDGLREVTHIAYSMFAEKNALDFTVFPSVVKMESDIINIVSSLLHGDDDVSGLFTSGGTESNFLAVYAARNYFRRENPGKVPEIVSSITAHPSFDKAADYLGMRIKKVPINPETFKLDIELLKEYITPETALVVISAPEWPFGSIDPVEEVSEVVKDRNIWLHVDACLGGMILPFLRKLGESIPDFDFSIEGIYSISSDLHKYGYSPKGASTLLFRNRDLKVNAIYASVNWPGYPFINPTMLSSRSLGPVAAAWAALHYLGEDGYLDLANMILMAKKKILSKIGELGLKLLGNGEATVLALTTESPDVFNIVDAMSKRGWHLQAQPGIPELDIPKNIHLTLMPIHGKTVDKFIEDLREAIEEAKGMPTPDVKPILNLLESIDFKNMGEVIKILGLEKGELPSETALINELTRYLPPELVEELFRYFVAYLY